MRKTEDEKTKKNSKLIFLGCLVISLLCALVCGFLSGALLAFNHPIWAVTFVTAGFSHAYSAKKAYALYKNT